ncbi:MAG: hypothetical protein LBT04_04245 [Prevotellaceae bacterium]|jgi:hypothetical protein|nr:hypothetical protein [Prevotellaceae bacterium]
MNFKQAKVTVLILSISLLTTTHRSSAQKYKWTNYYLETGILGGGSFYLGDVNEKLFNNMQPTTGLFLKRKFNGHWSIKLQATGGQAGIGRFDDKFRKTTFFDLSAIAEFNFFNFGAMQLEPFASPVSPYIFVGLGGAYFNKNVAPIVPFGVGAKYHFAERFNLGIYWSMQKTLWNDNFDLVNNPLGLNAGIWNNNDWYSTCAVYLSIDFWQICPSCLDGRKKYYYNKY